MFHVRCTRLLNVLFILHFVWMYTSLVELASERARTGDPHVHYRYCSCMLMCEQHGQRMHHMCMEKIRVRPHPVSMYTGPYCHIVAFTGQWCISTDSLTVPTSVWLSHKNIRKVKKFTNCHRFPLQLVMSLDDSNMTMLLGRMLSWQLFPNANSACITRHYKMSGTTLQIPSPSCGWARRRPWMVVLTVCYVNQTHHCHKQSTTWKCTVWALDSEAGIQSKPWDVRHEVGT